MLKDIADTYISLTPVILGGMFNMIFCKTSFFKKYTKPIDRYKEFKGKRILGDNKTTLGFLGMIVITAFFQMLWGFVCSEFNINNIIYSNIENTVINNILVGGLLGFMYVIMELPNSFMKRRLDIEAGNSKSIKNKIFLIIDQIDSLIGIGLALILLNVFNLKHLIFTIALGGITHICINLILVKLKFKESI